MANKEKTKEALYYRAFEEFRAVTGQSEAEADFRRSLMKSNAAEDVLYTARYRCRVESDWVEKIEASLPHFDAAIKEERQFIRQAGEVVPIEKAKRVSKESVEHLARHAELITHLPSEGEKLVPDKIYTAKNLSDYAIYENRFLYMALRYTKDFIFAKLDAAAQAFCRQKSELSFHKTSAEEKRNLSFSLHFEETATLDEAPQPSAEEQETFDRARALFSTLSLLLETPLMQELAKEPLLSPPITKTNVLRMNVHFKAVLELYEYLCAYEGTGYTVQKTQTSAAPFSEETADEFAELILLSSLLARKHGGRKNALHEEYLANKKEENENAPNAYLLHLEKNLADAELALKEKESEIASLRQELALCAMQDTAKEKLDRLDENRTETEEGCALKNLVGEDYQKLYLITKARYDALLLQTGKAPSRDFCTEEEMNLLEKEFEAFRALFENEWHKTKKKIRKDFLWSRKRKSSSPSKDEK